MTKGETLLWMLELRLPGAPSVAKLKIEDRAVIGRADKELGLYPDLDLTPWGAVEHGVAPEHIALRGYAEYLELVPLVDSPTLLNGVHLEMGAAYPVKHGDEILLGSLHIQIRVIASPEYGSIVHQQPGMVAQPETSPAEAVGDKYVLIVEDDVETAEIFRIILERVGFRVQICREMVSAIRALNAELPDAILLDLMLPDIHGLELCRYVRRDLHHDDIPIIVVSAAVTQTSVAQSMEVGADVFLGKPVSVKRLRETVFSLIAWHASRKPTQTKRLDDADAFRTIPADVRQSAVVMFVAGYQEPIAVVVAGRVTLGRRSGSSAQRPHVDLERYHAFDAGVSRLHAALHRQEGKFYVEDLDSSNGVWLNGEQLEPGKLYPLTSACELRLGHLRLRVFFLTDENNDFLPDGRNLN